MASSIITFRNEDIIISATLQRLIERDWRTHELFFDLAEPFKAWLKFEMMITGTFGDCRHDRNVISFRADIVRRGYDGDVDIYFPSAHQSMAVSCEGPTILSANLRLWNYKLRRITVIRVRHGMCENANSLEQMTHNLHLSGKV